MKLGAMGEVSRERIVFAITAAMFAIFSLMLNGFLAADNILSPLRAVAVLGILDLGMLIVALGRGIDLSRLADMAPSVAWTIQLVDEGLSPPVARAVGLVFARLMSLITGVLVAYAESPAIFGTLAMGAFIHGFGRAHLITGPEVV